jgi:Nif-specific regulatory protein
MTGAQDAIVLDPSRRPTGRAEMAIYGIYEISKILCGPGSLQEILSTTLNVLKSFLDMGNGLIALLDGNGEAETVVACSLGAAEARRYFAALPEKAIGQLVATEVPLAVEDVAADSAFEWDTAAWGPPEFGYSFMGVPIKDRDRVIGTLTIDRAWTQRGFMPIDEDLRFLKMVANLIGQTVRLHRLVTQDRARLMEDQDRLARQHENAAAGHDGVAATYGRIIGESAQMRRVLDKVRIVARSNSSVILRGESGTGKELFAQALHDLSPRSNGPYVKLNCAALPESVLESELFGHEKGAFTGAVAQRKGRFEMADCGTLFLDEIGEISPSFQAKLLRVLQEGEFERVGGNRTLKVDVRLVAATNRNLEEAVAKGTFRADLYYRISVVAIMVPPLRDRRSDIPLLADEFVRRFNRDNKTSLALSPSAVEVLTSCYFPGNVRELENCVRRTATMAAGPNIQALDFACRNDSCLSSVLWKVSDAPTPQMPVPLPVISPPTRPAAVTPAAALPGSLPGAADGHCDGPEAVAGDDGEDAAEIAGRTDRAALVAAMEKCGWVQAKAARLLGLTPRQIGYAMRKHGIEIQKF